MILDPLTRLSGEIEDEQARYAEATTFGVRLLFLDLDHPGRPRGVARFEA